MSETEKLSYGQINMCQKFRRLYKMIEKMRSRVYGLFDSDTSKLAVTTDTIFSAENGRCTTNFSLQMQDNQSCLVGNIVGGS